MPLRSSSKRAPSRHELRRLFAGPLSPLRHVAWTAIAVSALWRVKKDQPLQIKTVLDPKFLKAFIIPVCRAAYRRGPAQVAFPLEPTTIVQVAETAFSGGIVPQKSTNLYPKLLSGLTIYKIED